MSHFLFAGLEMYHNHLWNRWQLYPAEKWNGKRHTFKLSLWVCEQLEPNFANEEMFAINNNTLLFFFQQLVPGRKIKQIQITWVLNTHHWLKPHWGKKDKLLTVAIVYRCTVYRRQTGKSARGHLTTAPGLPEVRSYFEIIILRPLILKHHRHHHHCGVVRNQHNSLFIFCPLLTNTKLREREREREISDRRCGKYAVIDY